jgi:CRISPR-associated protein Cmr3
VWLFLEAVDVWMFRDGKPFNAGEAHIANTLFPPSAHTIQGAFRSFILDNQNIDPKTYINGQATTEVYTLLGNPHDRNNSLGQMQIYGPFLAKRYRDQAGEVLGYERYLPLPQDVTASKDDDLRFSNTSLRTLKPENTTENVEIQNVHLRILDIQANDVAPEDFWIAERQFADYLTGSQLTVGDCERQENLFNREYRSGNALRYDKRRVRSEEGMLYSASFIRPQSDVGLLIWVSDAIADVLPNSGFFRMGGEGRSTHYTKLGSQSVIPQFPLAHSWRTDTHRLKIVFLTPTHFSRGWLPDQGWFTDFLVGTALGRYMTIGGWDLRLNQPRPIRRYVPVGSVYYFEFQGDQRPEGLQLLDLPKDELPLHQLGYGHIAVGTW